MTNRKVRQGLIGANTSCEPGLYLIQVTEMGMEDCLQARAVLDEQQLRRFIQTLTELLPKESADHG